jgi:hypothetical protein
MAEVLRSGGYADGPRAGQTEEDGDEPEWGEGSSDVCSCFTDYPPGNYVWLTSVDWKPAGGFEKRAKSDSCGVEGN